MHKIQLKRTVKSFNRGAKQQICHLKNIRLKALIPANNDKVNFILKSNDQYDIRLRAIVCKIRTILKSRCHAISPNWLKISM